MLAINCYIEWATVMLTSRLYVFTIKLKNTVALPLFIKYYTIFTILLLYYNIIPNNKIS